MRPIDLGEGVALRPLQESDAEELYALTDVNREHLRRWLPWVDGIRSPADTLAFLRDARRQEADGVAVTFAILVGGEIAGVVGFHFVDRVNRFAGIGYWLGEDYEGRGLMTRSVRALADVAFGDWGLNRVEIRAATGNARSRAIPERLGFRAEGVLREREWLYDRFVDHVSYSLLATEWRSS